MSDLFYQGDSGYAYLNKHKKLSPKFLKEISSLKHDMYLQTNDGILKGTIFTFKVVGQESYDKIDGILKRNFDFLRERKSVQADFRFGSKTIRIKKSGGPKRIVDNDGNMKATKNPSTAQQESAIVMSLNAFPKTIDAAGLSKGTKFDFDKTWMKSFGLTLAAISSYLKSPLNQYETYLDSAKTNKPAFLNKMTAADVLPDSKDNWNPADIWVVRKTNKSQLAASVLKIVAGIREKKKSIFDLNHLLESEFEKQNLVGVSLKKISGARARADVIHVSKNAINSTKVLSITKKYIMTLSNSYFDYFITMEVSGKKYDYRFRFRPKGASGQLRIFGEGRPVDGKVFDGAVSAAMLKKMYPDQGKFITYLDNFTPANTVDDSIPMIVGHGPFVKYYKTAIWKLIVTPDGKKKMNEYEVKRALALLHYLFLIETVNFKPNVKAQFLSAKKMNEFSSVHLKVH